MTAHAQSTERADASVLQLIERRWTELSPDGGVQLSAVFEQLRAIEQQEAAVASDEQSLRAFRDRWESRKSGILTKINDHWLAAAPKDAKGEIGRELNRLRQLIREHIETAEQNVRARAATARLESERVDITLPARAAEFGPAHPITAVMERIVEIFVQLGYSVAEGPEMETVYYNFEALNVPESHPARDDQDTLYLGPDLPGILLRTHTSPVQIRTMEAQQPPLRVIVPGKVYRRDAPDLTHSPMFHQVEGLAVDEGIALADLKGTLDHFAREMFGAGVRTRFRPSYFPFTEPSAEMDVSCIFCGGRGCRACKQSGWIEVLGCGMVDPELYKFVHYDPQRWSGFAFGMGVDRLAMLMYGVDDVQRFFTGELRFLEQFRE